MRGTLRALDRVLPGGQSKSVTLSSFTGGDAALATEDGRASTVAHFYSLLVLQSMGAVKCTQSRAYGPINVSRGPECATLLAQYED